MASQKSQNRNQQTEGQLEETWKREKGDETTRGNVIIPPNTIKSSLSRIMVSKRSPTKQLASAANKTAILVFILAANCIHLTSSQCPVNTMTSFERIGGVTIKDSLLVVLYTAPNISSFSSSSHHGQQLFGSALDLTRQLTSSGSASSSISAGSSATSMAIPITAECNNRCRRSAKCRAFLVDYARHTCYSVEQPNPTQTNQGQLMRSPTPIHLVATQERTAYFEKVCLNLPVAVECERAWIYERVMGYHIHGNDDKIIEDVPSRLKCQEHCLNEREFRCRSGEYDYISMQCRLSIIDRHIRPNAFRPAPSSSVDYFENQCAPVGNQCDAFDRFEDLDLGRAEIMRPANTSDQCQQLCTQLIKAFICRSFTWNPITGRCYLNSANTFTVGGVDKLISAPGLVYYQRNDCIDLKLECDTTAMTLNLRTNEPFRGRMYVRDDPNSCETLGRSSLQSSLSIPFQPLSRCAQRELPNRYSSVVVVQQHPLIQRKSDRYIKVVCDFQTSNKTITSSYNVVANPWTSTALINATSFAPKIRLRITDKFGVDITGAKLGDELYLRIEAETESVYDMVARSVLAKSGTSDESIVLIDKDGCPTDSRIFPPLKKLNRRTILGKFDAFKFSSDVVVRFQVDVQFCLNQCPMTSCDQSPQLLNTNPSQLAGVSALQPDTYTLGSLTTLSPLPAVSSTPDSVASEAMANQPTSRPPQPPNDHQQSSVSQFYGRHPSVPANQPLGAGNFTGSTNSILDSLSGSGPDSQTFDGGAQPRSSNTGNYKSMSNSATKNRQQQVNPVASMSNSIEQQHSSISESSDSTNSAINSHQPSVQSRRRRRSAEAIPNTPKHVPLQREIIVESSPGSGQDKDHNKSPDVAGKRSVSGPKSGGRDSRKSTSKLPDGVMNRNEQPLYDLADGNHRKSAAAAEEVAQQQELNQSSALLCTTRHSLVLASLAFCAVQLLTISLCLVTWFHKKDQHNKFKVRHPVDQRLY